MKRDFTLRDCETGESWNGKMIGRAEEAEKEEGFGVEKLLLLMY